jgi:hypothetical protein
MPTAMFALCACVRTIQRAYHARQHRRDKMRHLYFANDAFCASYVLQGAVAMTGMVLLGSTWLNRRSLVRSLFLQCFFFFLFHLPVSGTALLNTVWLTLVKMRQLGTLRLKLTSRRRLYQYIPCDVGAQPQKPIKVDMFEPSRWDYWRSGGKHVLTGKN